MRTPINDVRTLRYPKDVDMNSLRLTALRALCEPDALTKAGMAQALDLELPIDADAVIDTQAVIPGRPAKPELVPFIELSKRPLSTVEGRAAMIHSIAHIEFNAIEILLYPDTRKAHRFCISI
jgi:uncharacterized ferritin-like protein (DUF455 family)